jgi:serine/threonine protein kinase
LKLGRYEVVRELGKGAMGIVYLAKDPLIGRLVALKTIRGAAHADDDETKEFQQRFIREAQAAGILNHPSIVTVHDIGQDDTTNTNFIAMEYVEGNNLKEVLAQGRALSFEQIGDIVAQVAEALDFAHSKGIVHRDVKPANIILLEGNRAKITDFGIAKIASGAANLTSTGQFLGTPNYMAPEQIKGAPVDGRTDIFALGICLYECLTRRKPFGGDSLTSISYKIVHEPFPPLHEINPQIPDGFEDVVANCLAKDPAKRYQRARDMANSLRAVIRGEKPVRPPEPMLADETIVTRDRDKQPTLEVPFPEAAEASASSPGVPIDANVGGSTRPAASAAHAVAAANAAPRVPGQPIALRMRRTLTNVRALPAWRRRVHPAIFVAITVVLVAALIGIVVSIRTKAAPPAAVDTTAEVRRAKERRLREEANALLRQGRVTDAYAKYEELSRLAPRSPFVTTMMEKLSAIRQQEEIGKAQLAQAQAKFDEGFALYNEKKYPEAIVKLQESFSLNPNSNATAEYLKLAQSELQKAEAARLSKTRPGSARTAGLTTAKTPTGAAPAGDGGTQLGGSAAPAQLTTTFTHPFTDGRIVVRAGADIVANEQLFDEKPARFLRRATRAPRNINVTQALPAKNADVQVWVTVPNAQVQEHHVIPAVRFLSGQSLRLVVRYDAASKRFTYEVN